MNKLVLIRHGQSTWNLENKFTGWVDVDLSELGFEEANRAGDLLKAGGYTFDIAFTSVLKRADKTLDIVLNKLNLTEITIKKDQALNERHYGDLQGKNKAETAKEYSEEQVKIWRRSFDVPPPNGESLKDTAERTLPYFDKFIMPEILSGKNVIIAAHGNSLRSIVMKLNNFTPEEILQFELETAVPLVYEMEDGKLVSKGFLR